MGLGLCKCCVISAGIQSITALEFSLEFFVVVVVFSMTVIRGPSDVS